MNNKGFAITGILYGLMLIFVLALTSFLSILVGKNRRIDSLIDNVYSNINYDKYDYTFSDENYNYEIEKTGLYTFTYKEKTCKAYLPINTVVITGKYKNNTDKLYYKYGGGSDMENYLELICINV